MLLSKNIKCFRQKNGLSQEELADRLNVVRQTVSKWERGLSVPDAQTLVNLAECFEVSVSELLGENISEPSESDDDKVIAKKLELINIQLANSAARKRKIIRGICIAVSVLTLIICVKLIISLLGFFIYFPQASFGGVDGPKEVFTSAAVNVWACIVLAAVFAVSIIGIFLTRKK